MDLRFRRSLACWVLILSIPLGLAATSCSAGMYRDSIFRCRGNKTRKHLAVRVDAIARENIVMGKTTEDEILDLFGKPYEVPPVRTGKGKGKTYHYVFLTREGLPTGGFFNVTFDARGRVQSWVVDPGF